jgi:hypothetical protein
VRCVHEGNLKDAASRSQSKPWESRNLKHIQFTAQAPNIMGNFLNLPVIREMEVTPSRLLG